MQRGAGHFQGFGPRVKVYPMDSPPDWLLDWPQTDLAEWNASPLPASESHSLSLFMSKNKIHKTSFFLFCLLCFLNKFLKQFLN